MTTQITNKFSLPSDGQFAFKGKVDDHRPFVEIDHMDNDILDDLTEIKFSEKTNINSPNQPLSQSELSTLPKSSASTISYLDESASTSTISYPDESASTSTSSYLDVSLPGSFTTSLIDVST